MIRAEMNARQKKYLEECKEIAISRGGLCLSDKYKNNSTYMKWKCSTEEHDSWMVLMKIMLS